MKDNIMFYTGRNKIGNMVGYVRLGTQCFRAYVASVRDANTDAQKLVRAKCAEMTRIYRLYRAGARVGLAYAAKQGKRTAANEFFKLNYPRIVGATPGSLTFDWSVAQVSRGYTPGVVYSSNIDVISTPNTVTISVTDQQLTAYGADADDKVHVLVMCPDAEGAVLSVAVGRAFLQTNNKIEVPVPAAWSGLDVHVYGFTISAASDTYGQGSNTDYIGHATLN